MSWSIYPFVLGILPAYSRTSQHIETKCPLVINLVTVYPLPFLKWKLPMWNIFKLPFSHPVMEILLPTGGFLLSRTCRFTGLLSRVRFIVTWSCVNPKTHPLCWCSDVTPLSMDEVKIFKMQSVEIFVLNSCWCVVEKLIRIMFYLSINMSLRGQILSWFTPETKLLRWLPKVIAYGVCTILYPFWWLGKG